MDVKTRAAGLCLAIIALATLAVPPVEAAPKHSGGKPARFRAALRHRLA